MECRIASVKCYNNTEIHCALWLAVALGLGVHELWNTE